MCLKFKFQILMGFYVLNAFAQEELKNRYRHYVAYKTEQAISIDGKADEVAWEKANWTADFIDIQGINKPIYKTNVKMLWDTNYYYVFAKIEEPHVWGNLKKRDTIIFYNNDFEVFIDPDGDTQNYYEIELNALNTVWDLFLTKPYREPGTVVLNDWNSTGLKTAISIRGSINNPKDIDDGWSVEIAIPFKDLRTAYGQDNVPINQFWRVNFSRVNWEYDLVNGEYFRKKDNKGNYLREYNWVWSPQGVINMHEPEKWGYVYFSSKKIGTKDVFKIPPDEKIKWELYRLYSAQKKYYSVHKKWMQSLVPISNLEFTIDGKVIVPEIENHRLGWTISVKSPFSHHTLFIREDGRFILKKDFK